jgi:hypothetical protein
LFIYNYIYYYYLYTYMKKEGREGYYIVFVL